MNNDFKRKVNIKKTIGEANPDQIEEFIENNKKSSISEEMLKNVKLKVYDKTRLSPVKKKNFNFKLWLPAAACLCVAVAVSLCFQQLNFENTTEIISSEDTLRSESMPNKSEEGSEDVSEQVFEDEIMKGVNWSAEEDEEGRKKYFNSVEFFLDREGAYDRAWVSVTLKNLKPLGTYTKYGTLVNGGTQTQIKITDEQLSVATIFINKIYYFGELNGCIEENETVEILVPFIVKEDEVLLTYLDDGFKEKNEAHFFPMTEIGKEYIIDLAIMGSRYKEILEDASVNGTELCSLFFFPMFSDDFTKVKNISEFYFLNSVPQVFVAAYDRYIGEKVSQNSFETRYYSCFKDKVYNIFGKTPEIDKANK
ncbi:MAG: hypothetical protein E7614_03025 [Ruminococcaceae bacterium]|nr:hypothetical protein [Oscillospiraceae bacterium]